MKHSKRTIFLNVLMILFGVASLMVVQRNLIHHKMITLGLTFLGAAVFMIGAVRFFISVKNKG